MLNILLQTPTVAKTRCVLRSSYPRASNCLEALIACLRKDPDYTVSKEITESPIFVNVHRAFQDLIKANPDLKDARIIYHQVPVLRENPNTGRKELYFPPRPAIAFLIILPGKHAKESTRNRLRLMNWIPYGIVVYANVVNPDGTRWVTSIHLAAFEKHNYLL